MHKVLLSILLSSSLLIGGIGASAAAEQVRKPEEQSFLERYTNAAQDVILQGSLDTLRLVKRLPKVEL